MAKKSVRSSRKILFFFVLFLSSYVFCLFIYLLFRVIVSKRETITKGVKENDRIGKIKKKLSFNVISQTFLTHIQSNKSHKSIIICSKCYQISKAMNNTNQNRQRAQGSKQEERVFVQINEIRFGDCRNLQTNCATYSFKSYLCSLPIKILTKYDRFAPHRIVHLCKPMSTTHKNKSKSKLICPHDDRCDTSPLL